MMYPLHRCRRDLMSVDAAVSNHGLRRRREPAGVRAGICSLDQEKNGNEKN